MEAEGEWETTKVDYDYEIYTLYPYQIRDKYSKKIIREWYNKKDDCIHCVLTGKGYLKHRIIAYQWIPNDDPDNKDVVEHINKNNADNRISNLRWTSRKEITKREK